MTNEIAYVSPELKTRTAILVALVGAGIFLTVAAGIFVAAEISKRMDVEVKSVINRVIDAGLDRVIKRDR